MKDGSTHTMDLVKKDDTTYWAFIDGTFTHAVVRQRALSGEDQGIGCLYRNGKAAGRCRSINDRTNPERGHRL